VAPCGSGKYCSAGACVDQISNGNCQNNNQCTSANCSNGLCCDTGLTGCTNSCVSLANNSSNCGSCGRPCAAGSTCSGGSCYLVDGQSCSTGAQCLGGVCGTFYLDSDGDGYGVGVGISVCGTTPPAGYANKAGDCCDSDKAAYPGSPTTFPTADKCGSFDYNCDTHETPQSNGPANCGTPTCDPVSCTYTGGCTCGGSNPCTFFQTAACGHSYYRVNQVCGDQGSGCSVLGFGVVDGTQACN
jgi:hypothetical protein